MSLSCWSDTAVLHVVCQDQLAAAHPVFVQCLVLLKLMLQMDGAGVVCGRTVDAEERLLDAGCAVVGSVSAACLVLMASEIYSDADLPWADVDEARIIDKIQNRAKLASPSGCPASVYNIMLNCWRIDPNTRSSSMSAESQIREIASHESLLGLLWTSLAELTARSVTDDEEHVTAVDTASAEARLVFAALQLSSSEVVVGETIGSGAFGEVRLGTMQTSKGSVKVAVKTLLAQPSADMKAKFELEARILCAVSHENVVRIVGYSDDGPQSMMILEFLEHGDLLDVLRSEKRTITTESMLQMCIQVCRAMVHLESLKVIHRDLAARNVLVGSLSPVVVKLSDVGMARTLKGSDYYRKTSKDKV